MHKRNRSTVVISALLTTIITSLIGGAFLLSGGTFFNNSVDAAGRLTGQAPEQAPIVVTVQPVAAPELTAEMISTAPVAQGADPAVIAAYQTRLDESYQALEEAYRQIETLQANSAAAEGYAGEAEHEEEGEKYAQSRDKEGHHYESDHENDHDSDHDSDHDDEYNSEGYDND
ncbi:MAG: hypothetical protein KF753_11220 [Caldilineaceae bacterium]|nr:hypothetical protein [Caldilineaceae bacterium]